MEDIIAISKFLQLPQQQKSDIEHANSERNKTVNKVSFGQSSPASQKIFEKIQNRISNHLTCLIEMLES